MDGVAAMRSRSVELATNAKTRLVAIVDARESHVYPPEVVDGLVHLMKGQNANIERTAFVIADRATFSLQAERMIREAANPNRRAFRSAEVAAAWLDEVLDAHERARVRAFLGL